MANVKNVLPIVQSTKLLGQSVAYYPTIAKVFNSPEIAIFICQFIYWCNEYEDDECSVSKWICKTSTEIYNHTGITPDAQITVRKKLKNLNVLNEKLMNVPAKLHFQFDFGMVNKLLCEGIPTSRKQRTDIQEKDKNGKFVSASVIYGNKVNEAVPVNDSSLKLRKQAAVNYGNKQPLIRETFYNKNIIIKNIKERESEKEFSQTLSPADNLNLNNPVIGFADTVENELNGNVNKVAPLSLENKLTNSRNAELMVTSSEQLAEKLRELFSDDMQKEELKRRLKLYGYSDGNITFNQAQLLFSVYSDWFFREKDPNKIIHFFSASTDKRNFLNSLTWLIDKSVVRNAFKNNPQQKIEKPNYGVQHEKPRYG